MFLLDAISHVTFRLATILVYDTFLLDRVSHVTFRLATSVVTKGVSIGRYKQQPLPFSNQKCPSWIYVRGKLQFEIMSCLKGIECIEGQKWFDQISSQ